jgi:hypothetical protein
VLESAFPLGDAAEREERVQQDDERFHGSSSSSIADGVRAMD